MMLSRHYKLTDRSTCQVDWILGEDWADQKAGDRGPTEYWEEYPPERPGSHVAAYICTDLKTGEILHQRGDTFQLVVEHTRRWEAERKAREHASVS